MKLTSVCLAFIISTATALVTFGAPAPVRSAEPRLTNTTGTVIGFDQESDLPSVNTRLGPKLFLVNNQTLVTLNDRGAAITTAQTGDLVELDYRFDTSVAFLVQLTRERRLNGRVTGITNNGFNLRLSSGGQFSVTDDELTRVRIAGINIDDLSVVQGLSGRAIIQPSNNGTSFLLLRMDLDSQQFGGRVTAVDSVAGTVSVTRRGKVRNFTLNEFATVRVNGFVDTLDSVQVGDRVNPGFRRRGGVNQALTLGATR